MTSRDVFALVRQAIDARAYVTRREDALQAHVVEALRGVSGIEISTEVIDDGGRFDVLVTARSERPLRVVLELKVRASVAAVERQAQRYAMSHGVDGVAVVTTSRRLARQLADLQELGGKPFAAIALRSW